MLKISLPKELNRLSVTTLVLDLIEEQGKEIIKEAVFSDDKEKPYGRKVLFQNDQLELLLTGWNLRHGCWPHTHGEQSEGIVAVLFGEGTFQTFASPESGEGKNKTEVLSVGKTIFVPRSEIHSMRNNSVEQLVCLHAYWPPVSEMRIYDPNMTHWWRISSGGAWKPETENVLEEGSVEHAS